MKVRSRSRPFGGLRKHASRSSPPARDRRVRRTLPIGAEVMAMGGVHFRVWAPKSKMVAVQLKREMNHEGSGQRFELAAEGNGYFSGEIAEAAPGMTYRFVLDSGAFPDPASRFQPEGPHGPSQIVDGRTFQDRKSVV